VKLECWRSHTVATITEALPAGATAQWQTRSLDFYAADGKEDDAISLWELPLRLPHGSDERPPSLELLLRRNAIELCADPQGAEGLNQAGAAVGEVTFFRVPLDSAQLAEFRSREPRETPHEAHPRSSANGAASAASWRAFYASTDERVGFAWQLSVRDLTRKAEWDRWKILEPAEARAPK
jgi:hypothetical protein